MNIVIWPQKTTTKLTTPKNIFINKTHIESSRFACENENEFICAFVVIMCTRFVVRFFLRSLFSKAFAS